ncbi:hypothetical protein [Kosakonia cowanii]|uniref:hypothetical protein n=1 Tax=Kosakonia cowanii TaxID=208223 RepID=UPI00289C5194|nr:hypothetical protein [Kosakonia cowanii]
MPSKLKLRRQRRLREDVIWWRAEAMDCKARVLELANLRVPMPVLVPARIIKQGAPATSEPKICISCNDGARHGCSSCAYRLK